MADNLHSTVVAWLKVILPLTALGLLSTLFLVSRTVNPEDAIPFADVDVEDRLREPRLTLPTWSGMTEDGAAVTVAAAEARPGDAAGGPRAAAVVAHYDLPGGGSADLTAGQGRLDPAARRLAMEGGVTVVTSDGWRMETAAVTADLARGALTAPGRVVATGPGLRLTAGRMEAARPGGARRHVVHFAGGVKLVYDPVDQGRRDGR
jgi:lipopolysaccharide export system protein LptC